MAQFVISENGTSFCVLTRYTALPEVGNGDRGEPFVHVKQVPDHLAPPSFPPLCPPQWQFQRLSAFCEVKENFTYATASILVKRKPKT